MQHDRNRPVGEVQGGQSHRLGNPHPRADRQEFGPGLRRGCLAPARAGLVKGLSIGAHPLKAEPILDKDGRMTGVRYTAWRWLELSAVTLPMNSDASYRNGARFRPLGSGRVRRSPRAADRQHRAGGRARRGARAVGAEVEAVRDDVAALKADIDDASSSTGSTHRSGPLLLRQRALARTPHWTPVGACFANDRASERRHPGAAKRHPGVAERAQRAQPARRPGSRARAAAALALSASVLARGRAIDALKASSAPPGYLETRACAISLEYSRRVSQWTGPTASRRRARSQPAHA